MSLPDPVTAKRIREFSVSYDAEHEDRANRTRGEFLKAFPAKSLSALTKKNYCIGFQSLSFCTFVEVTTRPWANILGASAGKFGIYYGRTKSDPRKRYRSARRFGTTDRKAFAEIRKDLLDLVAQCMKSSPDFQAIDANRLSQMFKAKILSLYYPKYFLNVCSGDHLRKLASIFSLPADLELSRYQHLLVKEKLRRASTRDWSNPRFMSFLYAQLLHLPRHASAFSLGSKPRDPRKVDFDKLLAERAKVGKAAENLARAWEIDWLRGEGHVGKSAKIIDRRTRPGYGYDFESGNGANRRYIEVKAVARRGGHVRFFLSANEHRVSKARGRKRHYFFYLVTFKNKKPLDVHPVTSAQMHKAMQLVNASYEAFVQLEA
jgi:Domain of unknown function (DUF3883)